MNVGLVCFWISVINGIIEITYDLYVGYMVRRFCFERVGGNYKEINNWVWCVLEVKDFVLRKCWFFY